MGQFAATVDLTTAMSLGHGGNVEHTFVILGRTIVDDRKLAEIKFPSCCDGNGTGPQCVNQTLAELFWLC